MKYSEKKTNSLKEGEGIRLLNFDGGREVPLSSFEGSPGDPLLNLKVVPGPTFKVWVGSRVPRFRVLWSWSHFYTMPGLNYIQFL